MIPDWMPLSECDCCGDVFPTSELTWTECGQLLCKKCLKGNAT